MTSDETKNVITQSKKINIFKNNPTAKQVAEFVVADALKPIIAELENKVEKSLLAIQAQINTIELQKGDQGEPGEKGEPGETPVAGIDFELPQKGTDGYTPIKGKDYFL